MFRRPVAKTCRSRPSGRQRRMPPPCEHQPIALGPRHVAAVVAQGQVEPAVVADDHAVGAVEPRRVLLGRQPQARQQVAPLFRHAVAVAVAEGREERRVHDEQGAVVVGEALDRVEAAREDRRLVGVAVAVGVLDEPDLVAADDLGPEAGDVVDRDEDRPGPGPGGDRRGVFDQRVAGEQGGLEAGRHLQRREPLLGTRARSGAGSSPARGAVRGHVVRRSAVRSHERTWASFRASRSRCGEWPWPRVRQPAGPHERRASIADPSERGSS